jgi:cell shape-determining protein MreC
MKSIVLNLLSKSKEYIILIVLLVISLSIIPQNKNPEIKKIKTYAFGIIAVAGNIYNSFLSFFNSNEELLKLKKDNAKLMLVVNSLREYALENSELKKLLNYKYDSNYKIIPSVVVSKI